MRRVHAYRGYIVALCSAAVVVCFFLPWIVVQAKPVAVFNELLGTERVASTLVIRGAEVPRMVDGPSQRLLIQVVGMFFGPVANLDRKSYLVWCAPILAVLVLIASWTYRGEWFASAMLGLLCGAIAVGVTGKILLTDLDGRLIRVLICRALWVTVLAFAVSSVVHFMSIPVERNPTPSGGG